MSDKARQLGDAGFVLPRWLRKHVRVLQRLHPDRLDPPRFAATMATSVLFASTVFYGVVAGGHSNAVLQTLTSRVGFAINHVEVAGNRHTSEIDVLQQVGLNGWTSMVGFDVREARERIVELDWVESAAVQKVYPATLAVTLVEKEPFALWQHGNRVTVIERNGDIIAPFVGGQVAALPLVIGQGARQAGPDFVERVERVRGLQGRVRAYIRVADRRWDLRLENGVTVKLPENGVDAALAEISRLDREYALLSRDIEAIDLRLPDRLTVALAPAALEARKEAFEEMQERRGKGASI